MTPPTHLRVSAQSLAWQMLAAQAKGAEIGWLAAGWWCQCWGLGTDASAPSPLGPLLSFVVPTACCLSELPFEDDSAPKGHWCLRTLMQRRTSSPGASSAASPSFFLFRIECAIFPHAERWEQ